MKKTNTQNIIRIKQMDSCIVVVLLLMLVFIPLSIKLNTMKFISPLITDFSLLQTGNKYEIYTSFKFYYLLIGTSILTVLFLIKVFVYHYEIKKTKMNIFLMLFIFILLISTLLSSFKYISLFGLYDRHEGVLTFLCYSFILFIASNISLNKNRLKLFFYSLAPFILINSTLSLLTFYGYNVLLRLNFIKKLIYSDKVNQFIFTEKTELPGTLYNVDYISGISSLFICLFFVLSIFEKRKSLKIANIILLICSLSTLLSSLAANGFIAIMALLPMVLLILIIKKEYKKFLFGVTLLISFSIIYIPLYYHNNKVWDETFGTLIKTIPKEKENSMVVSKKNTSNKVVKTYNKTTKVIKAITDSNFELPKLPGGGHSWGTGRGFIWKTTVPLILKKLFLGYGLNTFPYYFPQLSSGQLGGMDKLAIIDKPHSIYLGIAFGTGIIGLMIFLLMIGNPIFNSIIPIIKSKSEAFNGTFVSLAIVFVVLAYLIQGIVNDVNIGTDIVFFVFLGLLNSIILNKENEAIN